MNKQDEEVVSAVIGIMKEAGLSAIDSVKAERDRYRAALDEILEQVGTSDSLPPDLTIKAIENIAERALHPEEET